MLIWYSIPNVKTLHLFCHLTIWPYFFSELIHNYLLFWCSHLQLYRISNNLMVNDVNF